MKFTVFSMMCLSLGMASAYSVSDSNQVAKNKQADNSPNRLCGCHYHGREMKLEIFSQTGHRGQSRTKYLRSGRCYNIPSTGSARYDDGRPGKGSITFCVEADCQGHCYTASRSVQFYPDNIPGIDLGAYARSVRWTR
ncbi:hypothetical protein AX774_g1015 [Zancudomyces culisetae]|uniref:Uncharacterized protein n=1 Tax=Zancudomyces culisetae TaxID=1213189 RepID=A0A1R1PWX9_ZANCU|nr:hypothetical protein AX774_g1015 [Zancudomyces culisetae]|eukprot:OMH85434.1 hypothetical protein AX774_g1015 [Zancudomyces culisetae]